MIFVDGVDVGDIEDVALRDRRMLSADGIFIVVATVSEQSGRSVAEPEIIFRGVPFVDEEDQFMVDLRGAVIGSLARSAQDDMREIDLIQSPSPRRRRRVRLQEAQAPPDGAAGSRRGLRRCPEGDAVEPDVWLSRRGR